MSGKPFWLRSHSSCPECGHVIPDEYQWLKCRNWNGRKMNGFDCPHCKAHFSEVDYQRELDVKWGRIPDDEPGSTTIRHLPHPDDADINRCGVAFTRDEPQVLEGREDDCECLTCLVLLEEGKAARL